MSKLLFALLFVLSRALSACRKAAFLPSGEVGVFSLPPLPYDFTALEPVLWSQVVFIHYEKHTKDSFERFQSSASKNILASTKHVEELARDTTLSDPMRKDVTEHYSHYLYWLALSPADCPHAEPQADLLHALNVTWGGLDAFQVAFQQAALDLYEAGWVYLCGSPDGLTIIAVSEDDSWGACVPLLALDVWEHSYYLQYLSSKEEYVQSWWTLVDWQLLETLYSQYVSQGIWVPV